MLASACDEVDAHEGSMKILHVETGRHFYGGAQQVIWLIAGLGARGVENLLVCPAGSAIDTVARRAGIAVKNLDCGGDLDFRFAWRLARLALQRKAGCRALPQPARCRFSWRPGAVADRHSGRVVPSGRSRRIGLARDMALPAILQGDRDLGEYQRRAQGCRHRSAACHRDSQRGRCRRYQCDAGLRCVSQGIWR